MSLARSFIRQAHRMSIPSTMRAIQIQKQGGIDELELHENIPVPQIKEDEILVKTEWSGVNFIDTYMRGGIYKIETPAVLGNEPSGEVVKVGDKVDPKVFGFGVGDKVACYTSLTGYGEYSVAPANRVAKLPSEISTKSAASYFLQGLTALTAVREAHEVKKDEYILVHAAAGGLGLLLCQLASAIGAHVIGTTSTQEKADLAKQNGAEHVVLYKDVPYEEVIKPIKAFTPGGEGVHAVFDGVGKDTFEANFELLRRKGTLVTIGNASGTVPPFAPMKLAAKNLKLVRPTLHNYCHTREEFQPYAKELFDLIISKKLRLKLHKEEGYPFTTEGVRQAHRDISSRASTGKLIIKVA